MKRKIICSLIFSLIIAVISAAVGSFFLSPATTKVSGQQDSGWRLYVRTSPCSGRFDWLSVRNDVPPATYVSYTSLLGRAPSGLRDCDDSSSSGCTFTQAEALREAFRFDKKFLDFCCREYSVWRNDSTGKNTVVLGKSANPGQGWRFVKGDLCCEEAEALAGISGACHGTTNKTASCFVSDPGMGSTNREDHYTWAQGKTAYDLRTNLLRKTTFLHNCTSLSDDDFAHIFADLSVIIAKYAPDASCFDGDNGVISTDRNAHYQWARRQAREDLWDNLDWKISSALSCLDNVRQKAFFADLSVPAAQTSPTSSTNAGAGDRTRRNTNRDQPTPTPTPNVVKTPILENPKDGSCNASERALWAKISGTWKARYGHVTFSGSCDSVTGFWMQGTYGHPLRNDGTDQRGEITGGRISGSTLTFQYFQPWGSNKKGSDSCYLSEDGKKLDCGYMDNLWR